MIPGPTNLDHRVRAIMGGPQVSHASPEFWDAFADLLKLVKFVFKAENGYPYALTGSGSLAMEAAATSLIEPGEAVLVLETGHFGNRWTMINEALGAKVDALKFEFGKHADPKIVDEKLSSKNYKALFITHVDTATSVVNPIDELVKVARKHRIQSLVDSVCGVGGIELDFDGMEADVALAGSQKALAGPPGVALLCLSQRALDTMVNRKTPIRSYYMNLLKWKTVMDDSKVYLATQGTQLMLALREAIRQIKEEGLENRWRRHKITADALRSGIEALHLTFFAEEGYRANTVTGFFVPDGKAQTIQSLMRKYYNVHVAKGIGENSTKAIRIGHFGNISARDIISALSALESSLIKVGYKVEQGTAVEAAEPILQNLIQE